MGWVGQWRRQEVMHLLARRAFIVYSSSSEGGGGWRVGQLPPSALERRSRYIGRRPTSSASRPPTPHPLTAPTDRPKHSVRLYFATTIDSCPTTTHQAFWGGAGRRGGTWGRVCTVYGTGEEGGRVWGGAVLAA